MKEIREQQVNEKYEEEASESEAIELSIAQELQVIKEDDKEEDKDSSSSSSQDSELEEENDRKQEI